MYFANDAVSSEALGGYAEVSYFELRNGFTASGHGGGFKVIGGPVTVHHCWIHNCEADRGGAFSIEDGKKRTNPNKAVIVGNIIGQSIGAGTLDKYNYSSSDTEKEGVIFTSDIKALLEKIGTDINGNPFIKNGRVDMGAIQSK